MLYFSRLGVTGGAGAAVETGGLGGTGGVAPGGGTEYPTCLWKFSRSTMFCHHKK